MKFLEVLSNQKQWRVDEVNFVDFVCLVGENVGSATFAKKKN